MGYYNFFILTLHTSILTALTLFCFRLGKEFLIAFLSLLAILMNLFVLKQMTLFGLDITCSDALAVGYLLGLNLIQEFFGRESARKMIWISFCTSIIFLLLSQIHLLYIPSTLDRTHLHYKTLLNPQMRLICASLASFLIIQFLDLRLFAYLRTRFNHKAFPLRSGITLLASETLDTLLFSTLGLAGMVTSLSSIILFSLLAKTLVIFLSLPFLTLAKRIHVQV